MRNRRKPFVLFGKNAKSNTPSRVRHFIDRISDSMHRSEIVSIDPLRVAPLRGGDFET